MTDVGEARTPQEGRWYDLCNCPEFAKVPQERALVAAEAIRAAIACAHPLTGDDHDAVEQADAQLDSLLAYIKQLEETGEGWYQDALREGKQREAAEAQVKQLERRLREAELPTVEEIQGIYTEVRLKDELLAAEAQVKQLEGERDAERHRAVNAETLLIRERRGQRTQA